MNTKTIITSIVCAIIVVGLALVVYQPKAVTTSTTIDKTRTIVGGTSPEFASQYMVYNGITHWYFSSAMRTATTTLCSFPAPTASSTISYLSYRVFGNSGTAGAIDVGTSTAITGTSTNLLISAVTAGTSTGFGYIPTTYANSVLQGNQYINFVTNTLAASTTGSCQVELIETL
jgi:hypothetical protein